MKLAHRIANMTLLSTVSFTGCERGFDPAEYFRAHKLPLVSSHVARPVMQVTVADLDRYQRTEPQSRVVSRGITAGQLLEVRAWVSANIGESPEHDLRKSLIMLPVTLKAGGVAGDNPDIPWIRALQCFSLASDQEDRIRESLMYHRHSDERLGNIVDLREEQARLLRRQWMSQQLDGYARVVGAFGLDGCFYAVEYEKLDMVSP